MKHEMNLSFCNVEQRGSTTVDYRNWLAGFCAEFYFSTLCNAAHYTIHFHSFADDKNFSLKFIFYLHIRFVFFFFFFLVTEG